LWVERILCAMTIISGIKGSIAFDSVFEIPL
jgi:hypothetical protein